MFTAEQYRAKAAEFNALLANTPRSPNETSEFRKLAQTYTTLADFERLGGPPMIPISNYMWYQDGLEARARRVRGARAAVSH
jgi:hypothetical protein